MGKQFILKGLLSFAVCLVLSCVLHGALASAPPLDLSINDVSKSEGNSGTTTFTFTVSLSAPAGFGGVTFDIATADGTASNGSDYTAKSLTSQVIPAGSSNYTFDVAVNGDTDVEADETFFVNVTNVTGADSLSDAQGTCTITNDDLPALSIDDVSMSEGDSGTTDFIFTVSLLSFPFGDVGFDIATANGTADGSDYTGESFHLHINAGTGPVHFRVPVNGDIHMEPDETFYVNITNVTGAVVADGQGVGTILDDDTSYLSINDVTVSEGDTGTKDCTVTVSLSKPAGPGGVTFSVNCDNGTATAGSDYQCIIDMASMTIPEGSSSCTFPIRIYGDTDIEADETFFLSVYNEKGADVADGQATFTIENDDIISLSIDDASVSEGGTGTKDCAFTVSLSSPAGPGGVTFDIATADGTASAGSDYTLKSLTGQLIPAGLSSCTFAVPVSGDTDVEADETFLVNVTHVTGLGASIADGQGMGTIVNDDTTSLSVGDASVSEGSTGIKDCAFSVSLSSPAGPGGVTFDIATADGTASAGSDYTAKSLTGQLIPAGSSSCTFTVPVNGDTAVEADETFFVNVTHVSGIGASIADGQGMGTIVNDDTTSLSVGDVSVSEGSTGIKDCTFTVLLSSPAGLGGVTFDIAAADGTASAGSDYTAKSLTGQLIPAGSSSCTFTVPVSGDTDVEADETFYVNVTHVTGIGASIADGQGIGTIVNDDADTAAPAPGGLLTAKAVGTRTISLAWPAGSDEYTNSANLQYKVVRSDSDNVGTVTDAEANGTVLQDWTANLTSVTAAGLNASTRYYFTVIVKDAAGNKAVYSTVSRATPVSYADTGVIIIINGKKYAGTETFKNENGLFVGTVEPDHAFIGAKLDEAVANNPNGTGNRLQILVPDTRTNVLKILLAGDTVQALIVHDFLVSFEQDGVQYILSAKMLDAAKAAQSFNLTEGSLPLVQFVFTVSKPDPKAYSQTVKADGFHLIVPPVKIEITAQVTKADGTVTLPLDMISGAGFNAQLIVKIPAGVKKYAEGIAFAADGTLRPAAAVLFEENGKQYARFSTGTGTCFAVAGK